MALEFERNGGSALVGEPQDYSVSEDASPIVIGDTSAGVGQISATARAFVGGPIRNRSAVAIADDIEIHDTQTIDGIGERGPGSIAGKITAVNLPGERISITAETILSRLNTERTAKPFFGTYVPPSLNVTTRTNLHTNPSRETGLTGVTLNTGTGGTAALSRPTDGGWEGSGYARVTWSVANTGVDGGQYDTIAGIAADITYTFSGYYRATRAVAPTIGSPAQRVRLLVRFYNASNAQVGTDMATEIMLGQGEWTRIAVAHKAPANATQARMYCISTSGTGYATWKAGDTLDSDALLVEQGPLMGYFSGATPATDETDSITGVRTVAAHAWSGTAQASQSVKTISTTTPGYGYDATQASYFRYLCELVGLVNVTTHSDFENRVVAYQGWTGNVWTKLKEFCAAVKGEVALVDGVVQLRRPRAVEIPTEQISNPVLSVDTTLSSQYVKVYNYNSRWATDEVAGKPSSVLQVELGSSVNAELSTEHYLTSANNPVPVDDWVEIYDAGPGRYAVIDSQGLQVSASWWTRNGGLVTAEVDPEDPNKVNIAVFAPRTNATEYVGPFRIGRRVGVDILPAMDITGSGVFQNREEIRIRTGVSEDQTSTVEGATIDNSFITTKELAVTKGLDAAARAAGPVVKLSGTIAHRYLTNQTFGYIAGGRIRHMDNVFRIRSVRITSLGLSFDADADMTFQDATALYSFTFAEVDPLYAGLSFAQVDAIHAGKTFAQVDATFPSPTFARIDSIYEGARFLDHAIYPYVNEVING